MLIGFVDPSHYERAHDKAGRLPRWLTVDEVLLASQAPNPKWSPWTFEMVHAVIKEHQERGDRISTTALTAACPRSAVLERKVPYIDTLDGNYAALRGTMIHRTLEQYARTGAIPETRFYTTVDGIELSGSPDLVTTTTVFDYKVPSEITGVPTFGYPFRHQTEQLMTNAFILRHAEKWDLPEYLPSLPFDPREEVANSVVIVYIGPKSPKIIQYERKENFITPAGKEKEVKRAYVWSDEEVLGGYGKEDPGLRARLHIMHNALRDYPEWPEPYEDPDTMTMWHAEDIWGGPPGWKCSGWPVCKLPSCLARRDPEFYAWEKQSE